MNYIEYLANIDKYKGEDHSTFLQHYGILGQKWGQRRWQNADGTFNEEGKQRYFGKSSKSSSSDEDKVSGMKSDVKDYLKFRNKMLKKRTTEELNKWYRENNKAADKQMLKDAKKVDKQRDKFYKNQLKDFYDDPNELVSDLDRIYKIGGKEDKNKIGSTNYTWDRMDNIYKYNDKYQNADGTLTKKGQKLLDKGKNTEDLINIDLYNKSKYTEDDWKQAEEESQRHQNEIVANAKAKVKTTKELSDKDINEQEFKDIVEELNDFNMRDFYKNHRDEYNDVADIGMDALNKSDEYGSESKIGDDGDREWFMWEDQTIGNPEIAYLYYKGYSKDYIKQYLNKPLTEELLKMQDEDPYAGGFFVRDEFHRGGDAYIDALFDKNDQKIGSNPDKKAIKEGKKLEKELVKSMNKSWEEREKLKDKIINDPKYKEVFDDLTKLNNEKLAKEYSRLNEIFDDYEKNETENVATGGIASWMLDGNTKMSELGRGAWLYLFEDLNQGYANAESLYTRYEKNIDKKEIDYLYNKLHNNNDLHKENIQYLKDNNKALSQINDSQLGTLVRKNEENNPNNKTEAYWDLYNAADDSIQNGNRERNAYKEAKKVTQKLNKSCGNDDNGWDWLNKAIENLGMNDVDYKDMTQSDWDNLNAEINKLKK